jgi:hypothetical protein
MPYLCTEMMHEDLVLACLGLRHVFQRVHLQDVGLGKGGYGMDDRR